MREGGRMEQGEEEQGGDEGGVKAVVGRVTFDTL